MSDDTTVISLAQRSAAPNDHVVTVLREWLELARRGELRTVTLQGMVRYDSAEAGTEHYRYGEAGDEGSVVMAGMAAQHAHNLRMAVYEQTTDATPVNVPEEDEDE